MRLRITSEARRDLEEAHTYGSLSFGTIRADTYIDDLRSIFDRLLNYPELARERTEVRPAVRIYPSKSHHIFYRAVGEDLIIIRVLHRSVDWMSEL